jgi:D-proline reductase (dithiol) PrdB
MDKIDSYQFVGGATRHLIKAWIRREPHREIPWTPPTHTLTKSTVAMVSTAALSMKGDEPFDQDGERRDPWWGDPSYRVIPREATADDLDFGHLHMDNRFAEQDLDCIFPLRRLAELERDGGVGRAAPSHYSFMGYILQPETLLERSTPAMIEQMRAEEVDVVLLVPY